jgi:hypothetical protein
MLVSIATKKRLIRSASLNVESRDDGLSLIWRCASEGGAASAQRIAPPILADVLMFPNHLSIRPDSRVAS